MRKSRFPTTKIDSVSRRETLGDLNSEVLMAWRSWDVSDSGVQETNVEVLATTGIRVFFGA